MRKTILLFVACITSLWAADSRPVFKIGVIAPLTGDCAAVGQDVREGITLALEDNPKTAVNYEVLYEDSQNLPRLNNEAALRLINLNKVNAMISMWTPAANVIAPIVEKMKTPHFSISWDASVVNSRHWTSVYGPGLEPFAESCVKILKEAGCKRIAVASCVHAANQKIIPYLRILLAREKIQLVFDQQVAPSERDLRSYLLKLRESNPDGVLQLFETPQDEIFNRQALEIGFVPAVTTGWFDAYTPQARSYINGSLYPSNLWATSQFQEEFKKRFGHDFIMDTSHAYDISIIIIHQVERFYSHNHRLPSHEEFMADLKTPHALSDLVSGDAYMHENGWIENPFVIRKMQDGKPVDWKP